MDDYIRTCFECGAKFKTKHTIRSWSLSKYCPTCKKTGKRTHRGRDRRGRARRGRAKAPVPVFTLKELRNKLEALKKK